MDPDMISVSNSSTERNKLNNRFGLQRTTTATPDPVMTTTKVAERVDSTTSMSPELQEMRDHIMEMDAHDLRDAIMDPMMLGNQCQIKSLYANIYTINLQIF